MLFNLLSSVWFKRKNMSGMIFNELRRKKKGGSGKIIALTSSQTNISY